jgi:tetratricopeptide (TPR) repeat protein
MILDLERRYAMERSSHCLIISLLVVVLADGHTVEMTLGPGKAPIPAQKYLLLPKADGQTDADAMPLYEKAVQLLPEDSQIDRISQWLKIPPSKLPREQVQATLEQFEPILQLLEQAAKCRHCNWPYWDSDTISQDLQRYRWLVYFLALQMRLQVSQGQFDEAIGTVQAGFAMAKHLGEGHSFLHGLFGVAIGAIVCRQVEQFVQSPSAPNLYWALRALPRPFIDLSDWAEFEEPRTGKTARLLMNRLDRHVAALQCIEALRLYAAAHQGRFPKELGQITEVPVPDDPVMQKPFTYHRTGFDAVLEAPAPEGATERDAIRYELRLRQ